MKRMLIRIKTSGLITHRRHRVQRKAEVAANLCTSESPTQHRGRDCRGASGASGHTSGHTWGV